MASTEKFINLHHSLAVLTHDDGFIHRDKTHKIQNLVRSCAEQLQVERVSIWRLNDNEDAIFCEQLYLSGENRFESGLVLAKKDYPAYFTALLTNCIINADDANKDLRTAEFSTGYLIPLGITSLLDAPIFFKGLLYGVVCIEHIGPQRHWDIAELSYVASVADSISLINEHENWLSTHEEMALIGRTDALTGLATRRYLQDHIDRVQSIAAVEDKFNALILVGLDDFTAINERLGHKVADDILSYLGVRFEAMAHDEHIFAARVRGDIFGFWLDNIEHTQRITQLVAAIEQIYAKAIPVVTQQPLMLKARMGIVQTPQEGRVSKDPIRCAEVALKRLKESSDTQPLYFSASWVNEIQSQREMEAALLVAFDEHQLKAHYQPLVVAETGNIAGIEALVRWQHPEKGLLSPYHFLPLLADMGLMSRLGDYMLEQACADMRRLIEQGINIQWVSVNLSSDQLYDADLVSKIESLLLKHHLPSTALELEVVEELISQDSELVKAQLQAIDDLGVRLAIDDFGTGYSSLSRLKHLPVSKLKIDKSFVDGLPDSEDDRCIARSIIGLAKGIKVALVAEGVEHQAQAKWLTRHGVDYIQGYFYAKPMAFDDLVKYCRSQQQDAVYKDGRYAIERRGDIIEVVSEHRWDKPTAVKAIADIDQLSKKFCGKPWALLVDARLGDAVSLDVQAFLQQSIEDMVDKGLNCGAYIVGDSETANYQLELVTSEKDTKRRFFHDESHAINWLHQEGFGGIDNDARH